MTTIDQNQGDYLDEILTDKFNPWFPGSEYGEDDLEEAKEEIRARHQADIAKAVANELQQLIDREDIAWVKRGDVDSHEMFVHTNIIRDKLAALTTPKERKE